MLNFGAITKFTQRVDRVMPEGTLNALTKNSMLGSIQNFNKPFAELAKTAAIMSKVDLPVFPIIPDSTMKQLHESSFQPIFDITRMNIPELTAIQKAAVAWQVPLNEILKQGQFAASTLGENNKSLSALTEGIKLISFPTPEIISAISSFQKDIEKISTIAQSAGGALSLNLEVIFEALNGHRDFVQQAAEQLAYAELEAEAHPSLATKMKLRWTQMSLRKQILSIVLTTLFSDYILIPFVDPIIRPIIDQFACAHFPEQYAPCIEEREKRRTHEWIDSLERQQQKDRAINRLRWEKCISGR